MSKANYGVDARCDTNADLVEIITQGKNQVEICGIINRLLEVLFSGGNKVIDGDNPKDDYLDCISYDEESDNLYFWTENIRGGDNA